MTNTIPLVTISSSDWAAVRAFWLADEALIDSDVAYPDCPAGSDPEDGCGDCSAHQPLKDMSGRLIASLLDALVGVVLRDRIFEILRNDVYATMDTALTRAGVSVHI